MNSPVPFSQLWSGEFVLRGIVWVRLSFSKEKVGAASKGISMDLW